MNGVIERVYLWGTLVTFSHSIFALPFALIMLLVISRVYAVTWYQIVLLLVCVVSARTAAMTFNRIVDAGYDKSNERTKKREIPSGRISRMEAWLLLLVTIGIFVASAFGLGAHCGALAIPVVAILLGYSFVKRFSLLCHFVLGLSLALAPGGVWYALTAQWSWSPVPLMVAVLLWVAGFDIVYACQDIEFDRSMGLWSIPSKLGVKRALRLAVWLHVGSLLSLAVFGEVFGLGRIFWIGLAAFALLISSQHVSVYRRGLDCVNRVFFTRNGLASFVLLVFVALEIFFGS